MLSASMYSTAALLYVALSAKRSTALARNSARYFSMLSVYNMSMEVCFSNLGWAHLDLNQGPIGYEPIALTRLSYRPSVRKTGIEPAA